MFSPQETEEEEENVSELFKYLPYSHYPIFTKTALKDNYPSLGLFHRD
jgi:hypothetical protein